MPKNNVKYYIRICIKNGKLIELKYSGFQCIKIGALCYISSMKANEISNMNYEQFEKYSRRNKGIGIYEKDNEIIILNDPYCSIPLYIINIEEMSYITSEFADCYKFADEIDRAGIYEIYLYGSTIGTRTILDKVKQFAAAYKAVFFKKSYILEPYWNFEITENRNISFDEAVDKVYKILDNIFDRYKEQNIVMGLSGGLDSRLSACFLSSKMKENNITFFTFGYDSRIKEYRLACKVTDKLNLKSPIFIKLEGRDYINAMTLAEITGGQIGINHSHIYQCLEKLSNNLKGIFISNYYSDAIMGWDTKECKKNENIMESDYYHKLQKNEIEIPNEIKEIIQKDLFEVGKRYPDGESGGNFSCIDEFIYMVERNPKFHVRMSATYRNFMEISLPYANYKLLETMLSFPINYRTEKRIEQSIIEKYFFVMEDISSRRYFERGTFTEKNYKLREAIFYKFNFIRMRSINFINVIVHKLFNTQKNILFNPYLTENQNEVLNNELWNIYKESLSILYKNRLLSIKDYEYHKVKEYRSIHTGLRYSFIGLADCVQLFYNIKNKQER